MRKLQIGVLAAALLVGVFLLQVHVAEAAGALQGGRVSAVPANSNASGQQGLVPLSPVSRVGGMTTGPGQFVSGLDDFGGVNIDSVSSVSLLGDGFNLDLDGNLAYVAASNSGGLRVIDVTNPALPTEIGYNDSLYAFDVDVVGNYAFVADGNGFLYVVDVSNPTNPVRVAMVSTSADPVLTVDVFGDYAYCGSSSGTLRIFDVSTPTSPSLTGSLLFDSEYCYNAVVQGDTAYVANGRYAFGQTFSALRIVNVSNPASPSLIASVDFNADFMLNWVAMDGKVAYCGYGHSSGPYYGFVVLDVTDPINWSAPAEYLMSDEVRSIAIQDTFAVVSLGYSGIEVLNITGGQYGVITPAGSYPLSGYTNGMAISGSYIFQTNGAELTILDAAATGLGGGDVVDPERHIEVMEVNDSEFPDILVAVSVADEDLMPVTGLTASDFSLAEDEVSQEFTSVDESFPGVYILAYTTSNSAEDGSSRAIEVTVDDGIATDSAESAYNAPLAADPPSLDIGEESVIIGHTVEVPVRVYDFTGVNVIELYIDFDLEKLAFDTLTSEILESPVFNAVDGTVIVSWFSITSLELADGDTLFTLRFIASGIGHAEESPLTWNLDSYIADVDAQVISDAEYLEGSVTGIGIFNVNGNVHYYSSEIPMEGALVSLDGDTSLTWLVDVAGFFDFYGILPGSYSLTVSMEDEGHPGVNTLDAYRIQQSVETINPFTSGYELFASDVNMSESVNTLDAYKIQRVVVGLDQDFPAGDWAFIGTDYAMTTENWASATTSRSVDVVNSAVEDQDFFGMRIGDANGTWPSSFLNPPVLKLEDLTGRLALAEAVVGPGEMAQIELHASGLAQLGVIEWHIEFDPSVITLQQYQLPDMPGSVVSTTDSTISVSWFNTHASLDCDDRTLALFQFQAVNEVNVSSDLHLNRVVLGDEMGEELWTELVDGAVTVSNLSGVGYQSGLVTDWALRPAYPNPFNAYTTLSFDVKEASMVEIRVFNILGDLVTTLVQGNLPKGRYTSSVNANTWSSGTYFVVMKTNSFSKVQKIVLLK